MFCCLGVLNKHSPILFPLIAQCFYSDWNTQTIEALSKSKVTRRSMQKPGPKRRRTTGPQHTQQLLLQHWDDDQGELEKEEQEEETEQIMGALPALPAANWLRRGSLLEGYLVGEGKLLRELVGIIKGYCGKAFEGTSTELKGHTGSVASICVLGDGRLASGSDDHSIRIWDLNKAGECIQTLTGHTRSVRSVCALGNGRMASGSDDHTIHIWDLNKGGECIQILTGHTDCVLSVCTLGDGRMASASYDNTIRIWDLSKGGECVQTLTGHTDRVRSVCTLGDGRLASCSDDGSVRIWC